MLVLSPSHGGGTTMKIGTILSLALFCSHNGSHAQQYMTGDVNYTSALAEGLIDPVVLANCPEDSANWGKTTCTPPASFDVVPTPYQDLPLMKNNEKWQDLRPLEEYELVPDDVNNADGTTTHTVTLQLTPAYYLGPSYNTPLMTYNGLSRKLYILRVAVRIVTISACSCSEFVLPEPHTRSRLTTFLLIFFLFRTL